MDITPTKLVESTSRCFICSSATLAKDQIYSLSSEKFHWILLHEAIRTSLAADVRNYSDSSELFVCGVKCYQLNEIKKEIEETFNAREKLREKRLQRSNGEVGENITPNPRGKASKSLRFSDNTYTSSRDTDNLEK